MKIQCNACGATEAWMLCYADEAVLCTAYDEEVHAANKLIGKHQRIPLLSDGASSALPTAPTMHKCNICQGDVCCVRFVEDVHYIQLIEHAHSSVPSSAEQPTCPVCLAVSRVQKDLVRNLIMQNSKTSFL